MRDAKSTRSCNLEDLFELLQPLPYSIKVIYLLLSCVSDRSLDRVLRLAVIFDPGSLVLLVCFLSGCLG
jgi:hypothetical protein